MGSRCGGGTSTGVLEETQADFEGKALPEFEEIMKLTFYAGGLQKEIEVLSVVITGEVMHYEEVPKNPDYGSIHEAILRSDTNMWETDDGLFESFSVLI
jgi:hypothetical protein